MSEQSKNRNENYNQKFLLAPSNSQLKSPILSQNDFRVSIDRLTIVANLSYEAFENAVKRWKLLPFFERCGSGWQVLDKSNCYYDDFGNKHDYVPPEQVAYLEMPKFLNNKIRIDFNPNHGMETEAGRWLLANVIAKLPEKHFSRCDIAFDIFNHAEIENYQLWQFGIKKKYFYGRGGNLETIYFGSRSSERQIRLYNKKVELEKRHGKIVNLNSLWRLELQLRGSKIENYVNEVKEMLEHFYMPDWENEVTLEKKMKLYALMHEPKFYSEATKKSKERYRKMIKEAKPKNGLTKKLVHCFIENYSSLEFELQKNMQRFKVN